jgi:hypothetical protein
MKTPKFVTIVVSAVVLCIHRATAFAAPETATPLTYEMMAKSIYKEQAPTVFPEEVKKLEGKRVKVFGSAVPDDDSEKMFKFLMLKAVVGCFYCNLRGEDGIYFIRLSTKEKSPKMDGDKLKIEGTLHLKKAESKDEEAKIIPAHH